MNDLKIILANAWAPFGGFLYVSFYDIMTDPLKFAGFIAMILQIIISAIRVYKLTRNIDKPETAAEEDDENREGIIN